MKPLTYKQIAAKLVIGTAMLSATYAFGWYVVGPAMEYAAMAVPVTIDE